MSSPAPQGAAQPSPAAGSAAPQRATTPAGNQPTGGLGQQVAAQAQQRAATQAQQAVARSQQPSTGSESRTPRRLRLARTLAAGAALLTGLVGTGTFATDGLNATPDVVAQQWAASERAGVEIAHADLLATQRVAKDSGQAQQDYDAVVARVTQDLTAVSGDTGRSAAAAQSWSDFVVGAERAAGAGKQAAPAYQAASEQAQAAVAETDTLAAEHADDLRTGSRSALTSIVGAFATLVLLAIGIWLAVRTHRVLNLPLTLATLITAGLTYVSLDPSALPVDYDAKVQTASATAHDLQQLYQDRQAVVAKGLGMTAKAVSADSPAASADTFATEETRLRGDLEAQLGASNAEVGRPAVITSGVALLLGLAAAALAWTGISRRLQDYR